MGGACWWGVGLAAYVRRAALRIEAHNPCARLGGVVSEEDLHLTDGAEVR